MKRGFTLIEVLVTLAIVSILAGMIVPAAWRLLEDQEVQATREKLNILKSALVGDKSLVQGGIRTSYGIVGDIGELPFGNATTLGGLKYLVSNPAPQYQNWNGPYLSSYDPATYAADAWGRPLIYTLRNDLDGYGNRHLSGEIRSAGIDGIPGNSDDIFVELSSREVAPTYRMQGNIAFSNQTSYRAGIIVTFRDPLGPSGETTSTPICAKTFPNFTTIVRDVGAPTNLPIGKATISTKLYKNSSCAPINEIGSLTIDYFVSDNLSRLFINLPTIP